jgi:2-hydroxy-3-keto-5-methylthiopentenyl-1-phosphate phosphatase
MNDITFQAIVSSDWSECLSPNGPFDPISFAYPELSQELSTIFRQYTGNVITLTDAVGKIKGLMPSTLSQDQMDAYLDAHFKTYKGVPDLIEWCLGKGILFMINTTGTQAYFQRAMAKGLIPSVPVIAANPMIRYAGAAEDPRYRCEVHEIEDKPKCTAEVMKSVDLPADKLVVMGDSGGDGAHFQWAAGAGGFLIANMAKSSLTEYCGSRGVVINRNFGLSYGPGEARDIEKEMLVDYTALKEIITEALKLSC